MGFGKVGVRTSRTSCIEVDPRGRHFRPWDATLYICTESRRCISKFWTSRCVCACVLWPSENGYQQAIDDEYPSQKGKSFQNKDHQEMNPPERVASINHMIRHMEVDTTISSPLRTTRSLRRATNAGTKRPACFSEPSYLSWSFRSSGSCCIREDVSCFRRNVY